MSQKGWSARAGAPGCCAALPKTITGFVLFWGVARGAENAGEGFAAKGLSMRKVVTSVGFAAVFAGLGRFLFAPLVSAGHANRATAILVAAGLFTVAIAAAVRK
jgi:hypothetical protein